MYFFLVLMPPKPPPITITQLVNDSSVISDLAVKRFCVELQSIIPDMEIRTKFIETWKCEIEKFRKESKSTTGSRINLKPTSVSRPFYKNSVLDKLRPPRSLPLIDTLGTISSASEWIVTEGDLQRLAKTFPVKIFGRRSEASGKRKRGAAGRGALGFDQQSGSYYAEVSDGCLQLSNGLIEIFFTKAELILEGFYD